MPSLTSSCPYQPAQPILPSAFKLDSALWLPPHTPQLERSHENRKGRSKRRQHKSRRKQRYGAYIVQMIGVLCLVLAAFEGFEPLTGVGFTLVIVGFKGGVEKDKTGRSGLSPA